MGDRDDVPAARGGLIAETLGLAMARRAADVLSRQRETPDGPGGGSDRGEDSDPDPVQCAADDAVFTAVLDAANECLGSFDARPPADRWCDALLQVLRLAEFGAPR